MKIPNDFMIGTSSSAWQIEGIYGRSNESWADLFYRSNPNIWHNHIGPNKASDFYHHYIEDIEIMAKSGMNTFRFTIQWGRFMKDPISCIVDEDAVAFYSDVIYTIKKNGMKPIISLEHWDIPAVFFKEYQGWASREIIYYYEFYVNEVLKRFHNDVELWFAFTEPNIPIDNGYMEKLWYPFQHNPILAYQAHFNKILATSKAVKIAHQYPDIKMGAMIHMTPIYSASNDIRDCIAAYYADLFHVRLYLDPYLKGEIPKEIFIELEKNHCLFNYYPNDLETIKKYQIDILGIDYYFPIRVKARTKPYTGSFHPKKYYEYHIWPKREFNEDRGWEIYPQAIYDIGMRIKNDYKNKKWFISENGIGIQNEEQYRNKNGYINDVYRINFLKRHLEQTLKVTSAGSNCHGYLIWSFIDNISALNAFKNRYGLLELNLKTYNRIPKESYYWLQDILKRQEV